jgi:hydroxypyruvate reductase
VSESRRICFVSSGETTVRVVGDGCGGRNLEFALAASVPLAALGIPIALASVGTDGIDGSSDAAGAISDSTTMERASMAGLDPQAFLRRNDSHAFFATLGDLVRPGPTGTIVGDLQVTLVGPGLAL